MGSEMCIRDRLWSLSTSGWTSQPSTFPAWTLPTSCLRSLGVYIYQWEEKNYGHGRALGMPRLCRTPSPLHMLECILLLHKNHYVYMRHFQRLMSCASHRDVKTTRKTHAVKY